jgi:hypothetical protein
VAQEERLLVAVADPVRKPVAVPQEERLSEVAVASEERL